MEIRFNLAKEARRALIKAVSEIMGEDALYQGAPSFAFKVGGYTVDRYGTLSGDDLPEALLGALAARGFVCGEYGGDVNHESEGAAPSGPEEAAEVMENGSGAAAVIDNAGVTATASGEGRLSIDRPVQDVTPDAVHNLERLVAAKAWVFKKMTGTEELPIERLEGRLSFPWFAPDSSVAEIGAYSCLITRLCETAKAKKRVAATERPPGPGDNEKFKARCALLALGFIGAEYAEARKILLAPFSGSGSHKSGSGRKNGVPLR
ncbi:MAG: hypothetical protein LBK56_12575 [Gracilibacteraceae bacterium]|nr:hypothetical protein [Gracilibacteraceae bacterium]